MKQHSMADPMHHRRSLRDHPHGRAKGPWGPRGRLAVTKRWPWTSRRPIPVQRTVIMMFSHWHRKQYNGIGWAGGDLGFSRYQPRDGTRTIKAMIMHSSLRPRRHTNVSKCMESCACVHLLAWPLVAAIAVLCRHVTKPHCTCGMVCL